jgi:hypothetical protein
MAGQATVQTQNSETGRHQMVRYTPFGCVQPNCYPSPRNDRGSVLWVSISSRERSACLDVSNSCVRACFGYALECFLNLNRRFRYILGVIHDVVFYFGHKVSDSQNSYTLGTECLCSCYTRKLGTSI